MKSRIPVKFCNPISRSPYGERGLKYHGRFGLFVDAGRSPYGERGLKCLSRLLLRFLKLSLSLRRAWIEITSATASHPTTPSRSPYGERGLKFICACLWRVRECRSPYGERGLKLRQSKHGEHQPKSLSLRRAWIEIFRNAACTGLMKVALLTESVD